MGRRACRNESNENEDEGGERSHGACRRPDPPHRAVQTANAVVAVPAGEPWPPASALPVHALAFIPEGVTGSPAGLLGKLPVRCRPCCGWPFAGPALTPPDSSTAPAGQLAVAVVTPPGVSGPGRVDTATCVPALPTAPQTAKAAVSTPDPVRPPESATAVQEPAVGPGTAMGEPSGLLGKLPVNLRLGEGDPWEVRAVSPPPPSSDVEAGQCAVARAVVAATAGPATLATATWLVAPAPSTQRANSVVPAPRTNWPPVAPAAVHAPGRAPEAVAGLPLESEGWVPSTWRLEGGVPPPMGATLTPPPASTAPGGQPPVALTVVAGADGPRTVLIATTSLRGEPAAPGPAGAGRVTNAVVRSEAWRREGRPQAMQVATSAIARARKRAAAIIGSSTRRTPSSWYPGSSGRRLRRLQSRRWRRLRRRDGRRRRWERSPSCGGPEEACSLPG